LPVSFADYTARPCLPINPKQVCKLSPEIYTVEKQVQAHEYPIGHDIGYFLSCRTQPQLTGRLSERSHAGNLSSCNDATAEVCTIMMMLKSYDHFSSNYKIQVVLVEPWIGDE